MTDSDKTLRRVRLVSGLNGWTVAIFGLMCVTGTLALGSGWWALLSAGMAASGFMELAGRSKLKSALPEAGRWLSRSQIWLLALILSYCTWQIVSFNADAVIKSVSSVVDLGALKELGMDEAELKALICKIHYAVYIVVMSTSLLYQGGLWLYYRRSVRKLRDGNPAIEPRMHTDTHR